METTSNEQIFNQFESELKEWGKSGKTPDTASLDLGYSMGLQHKRLQSNGITADYKFKSRGKGLDDVFTFGGNKDNGNFKSTTSVAHYKLTKIFYKSGSRTSKYKRNRMFYAMITRLLNQDAEAVCCCPNCGAISDIKTLLGGCPHCKTKFIMNDLFPKVTNYLFVDDYAENRKSMAKALLLWTLIPAAALAVYFGITNYKNLGMSFSYIFSIIAATFTGAFAGYILWAMQLVTRLVVKSILSIPSMDRLYSAKRNLSKCMKQIDNNFSYEYFVGKIISLMKMMIFSDDYSNLAVYEGRPAENRFNDIIDVDFTGVIRLNSFNINGNYCYVDMNIYTKDYVIKGNSIRRRNDVFRINVCRNIHTLQNPNFSLKRVECRGCGASFDATREHNCPYCKTPYHLGDDDWVVLNFGKV